MRQFVIAVLIVLAASCQVKKEKLFELLPSKETGVEFSNDLYFTEDENIIEYLYYYNGGGVSVSDINNDGLLDLFFTANQKPNALYLNKGNFQFEEISISAGIAQESNWSTGVNMADVNGDGYIDIYVCNVGKYKTFEGSNQLFINNGDLTFTESSQAYGLDFSGFSTQTSFFDYDQDGDLDMYLLNHSVHTPRSYRKASTRKESDLLAGDRLYENLLNEGLTQFRDVTQKSGIFNSTQGFGLGLVTSDINQDGWMDIYVGNDFHENDYLYINQGDGTFKESIEDFISHTSRFSMGVDVADINGDNLLDIISMDMLPRDPSILLKSGGEDQNQVVDIKLDFGYYHQYARNTLQLNKGNKQFAEIGMMSGIFATDWSWSVLVQDFDNDGNSDVYISNGILKRPNDLDYISFLSNVNFQNVPTFKQTALKKELIDKMPTLKIPNYTFQGNEKLEFKDVTKSWGLAEPSLSNGAVYADLDLDGDQDIVVNNVNAEAFLFRNNSSGNNFLDIALTGSEFNDKAIGAKVTLHAGDWSRMKEVSTTRGFQSSVHTNLHFGLGKIETLDSIKVQWPDRSIQIVRNIGVNELIEISMESMQVSDVEANSTQKYEVLDLYNREDGYKDYNREHLIPRKLSHEGPALAVGDVNSDGYEDLFIGGAHWIKGSILLGNPGGSFTKTKQTALEDDDSYEDTDAVFYDLDNDLDLDLYVVSGGNKYNDGSEDLEDRIYINDGTGEFTRLAVGLPRTNGSVVEITDYNEDGNPDIFVGARSIPGSYGKVPISYLLTARNNQIVILEKWQMGMVSDAVWLDYNNDDAVDLAVVGEWMPLTIFENTENGQLKDATEKLELRNTSGWWMSLDTADLNTDGYVDLIAGNHGKNSKIKASLDEPVTLYLDDFDANGQTDPLIFHYYRGESIPMATNDDLVKQMPFLKKDFLGYSEFSKVRSINDLVHADSAKIYQAFEMKSIIFMNDSSELTTKQLPDKAQWSTIQGTLPIDFDMDNDLDLIIYGNDFSVLSQIGRMDANSGAVFKNIGDGMFEFHMWLPVSNSLDIRHIELVGSSLIVIPNNSDCFILPADFLIKK